MIKIAVFASGSGTNAENVASYFAAGEKARVTLILSNRPDAPVLERARRLGIGTEIFDRDTFYNSDRVVERLRREGIGYIVLAGFLWLVPDNLLGAYGGRILNVHPSLLPRHGGKGMYGDRVHRAVVESGDRETGITIHRVNEHYDSGDIVARYRTEVEPGDTPERVAEKVHALEYRYYPLVIEAEIDKLNVCDMKRKPSMRLLLISNSTNAGEAYLEYPKRQIADFLGGVRQVAFVPYAAVTFSYDDYLTKVQARFSELGIDVRSVHRESDPARMLSQAEAIVVGHPRNMDGTRGESAQRAEAFAAALGETTGLPVNLWDERLTTASAIGYLNMTDTRGKKRKAVVDTVAATIILQDYLDSLRLRKERETQA